MPTRPPNLRVVGSGQSGGKPPFAGVVGGLFEPTSDPFNLDRYADEVMSGLPDEKASLDTALENQAFYDREGERYLPQRDAESTFDFMGRPKRQSGIVHQTIEVLCDHLYSPGPSRQFKVGDRSPSPAAAPRPLPRGEVSSPTSPTGRGPGAAGGEGNSPSPAEAFLERVWTDNLWDALVHRADKLATLNDVCAIQVDAGAGDFDERPITLRLWGREEFHVWTHPDDATQAVAVVTIDRYNLQTRYRLWGRDEVRTYLTKQGSGTAGGRIAEEVSRELNTYGEIPFGFVHYDLPVRRFFTPAPGTFLRKCEVRIDDRLSLIDEAIGKHLNPLPVLINVPLGFKPIIEPQRFIRLQAEPITGGDGGLKVTEPDIKYLQATIDVAGAWEDLLKYMNQVLEACRVPLAAVRMEQTQVASGIALIAEQAPLLSRARCRRGVFAHFKARIARTILCCAGNHYGKPELLAAAESGRLTLGWPEPTIPIPGPERDQNDANAMGMGIKSRLMVIQERYGCTRDQALQILRQIAEDLAAENKILPIAGEGEAAGGSAGATDDQGEASDDGQEEAGRGDAEETDQTEQDKDYDVDGQHDS